MGIRIEVIPFKNLAVSRDLWRIAADKFRSIPDDVAEYKGLLKAKNAIADAIIKNLPNMDS